MDPSAYFGMIFLKQPFDVRAALFCNSFEPVDHAEHYDH